MIKIIDDKESIIFVDGNNLRNIDFYPKKNEKEDISDFDALAKEYGFSEKPIDVKDNNRNPYFVFYLILSKNCNLKCSYCFNGKSVDKTVMDSVSVINTIKEELHKVEGIKNVKIAFSGGEPLIQFNLLQEIVSETKKITEYNFSYSINTNGLLLDDDIIDFLLKERFTTLISCDGFSAEGNSLRFGNRKDIDHALLMENIKKFIGHIDGTKREERLLVINMTISNQWNTFIDDLEKFSSLGIKYITYGPIVALYDSLDEFQSKQYFEKMNELYIKLYENAEKDIKDGVFYKKITTHYYRFYERIVSIIKFSESHVKLYPGCHAGHQHLTILQNGDIVICPLLQEKEFNKQIVENEIKTVMERHSCRGCWNRFLCGGGCYASNYSYSKDINIPSPDYCRYDCLLTELSIKLLKRIVQSNDRTFHDYFIANNFTVESC